MIPRLATPWERERVVRLPARTLAYVGDSVFELCLRLWHVAERSDPAGKLHESVVGLVCADRQSELFERVFPTVSEEEQVLLKNWRNAKMPSRHGGGSRGAYARATAFEAWIGYLYLTGQSERLEQTVALVHTTPEPAAAAPSYVVRPVRKGEDEK
ncbi:MAG TPA: ribonuclease III domain-containing protein [Candidatus Ozemobacteraceae bacterium]|nr:ribonuclease III domain-containing protein [Candidatus Ozemobacteraceae bacterium]